MIPTLLSFINENKGFDDTYGIFEVGHVIGGLDKDGMCDERKFLGIALSSRTESEEALFLHVRDMLTMLGGRVLHEAPRFTLVENESALHAWEHPKNTFAVSFGGQSIGRLAILHPKVSTAIDKKAVFAFAELDLTTLATLTASKLPYREVSKYPAIEIDLCFYADTEALDFPTVEAMARESAGSLLRNVLVTDLYRGEGGDSITLRFVFSAPDRTLTKAELQPTLDSMIENAAALGMRFKTV